MPRYKATSPSGKTLTVEGDTPPTEQEWDELFNEASPTQPQQRNDGFWMGSDLSNAKPYDPLALIAKGGQKVSGAYQAGANLVAEKSGEYASRLPAPLNYEVGGVPLASLPPIASATVMSTAADYLMPQNRLGAILTAAAPALDKFNAVRRFIQSEPVSSNAASLMTITGNVPRQSGQAALKDLDMLGRAPTSSKVSELYQKFHAKSGTKSLKAIVSESANPFNIGKPEANEKIMVDALEKLRKGELTLQDAINASQAGRMIRDAKISGNEYARSISDVADNMKGEFDDYIQSIRKGWQPIRQAAFESNVAEDFSQVFPVNKTGGANVLRPWSAGLSGASAGAYIGGRTAGVPGAAVGAAVGGMAGAAGVSPKVYGSVIKNIAGVTKIPLWQLSAGSYNALSAAYNKPRPQTQGQ